MTTEQLNYFHGAGFHGFREIPGKGICGLKRFIFTVGLCYNLQVDDFNLYEGRYCFESHADAESALASWDGIGDAPGDWIKHKGGREYSNPNKHDIKT